jgi:hypothetical protein
MLAFDAVDGSQTAVINAIRAHLWVEGNNLAIEYRWARATRSV